MSLSVSLSLSIYIYIHTSPIALLYDHHEWLGDASKITIHEPQVVFV